MHFCFQLRSKRKFERNLDVLLVKQPGGSPTALAPRVGCAAQRLFLIPRNYFPAVRALSHFRPWLWHAWQVAPNSRLFRGILYALLCPPMHPNLKAAAP